CIAREHVSAYLDSLVLFFTDSPTPEIYTLSLHDALPICTCRRSSMNTRRGFSRRKSACWPSTLPTRCATPFTTWCGPGRTASGRSEEHTSELQSRENLVCRLLLEKKKKEAIIHIRREMVG